MSYNRLNYDKCAYEFDLKQSVGPLYYQLDPTNFYDSLPYNASTREPNFKLKDYPITSCNCEGKDSYIDIDSDLKNLNRKTSNCPTKKYNGPDKKSSNIQSKIQELEFNSINSRLTNPIDNYRGLTVNRFVDLGINPLYGGYRSLGRDTRLEAKDLYVPCLPIPLDTSLVMPKPTKFTPSFNCDSTCKMSS